MSDEVLCKELHWEDADEGFCTKWKAAALGGHYELVWFEDKQGFSVNFSWGRPLSFWFIQGEPDEHGPTGPKSFTTLDQAKAAAQADYEARILSALEPTTSSTEALLNLNEALVELMDDRDAELAKAVEALRAVKQHEVSVFWGVDAEKNSRASWRGVMRKVKAALAYIEGEKG
jgi:hypothetical protein